MAFNVYGIISEWMDQHSPALAEYMVLLMLEEEGFDIRESLECITLLKNHGFFYCPNIGKIALASKVRRK